MHEFARPVTAPSGPTRVTVMSAREVAHHFGRNGTHAPDMSCDAMVGIKTPGFRFPGVDHARVGHLLRLAFADVLEGDEWAMDEGQARAVAELARTLASGDALVVHCEGGVSRSAGVASAVMDLAWGDGAGDVVWRCGDLWPNEHCWRLVREAGGLVTTEADVRGHVQANARAMREA